MTVAPPGAAQRRRLPPDGRRSSWAVVAAAAAVALIVGAIIGRSTAPMAPAEEDSAETTQIAGPGPTELRAGVPVGYAHTEMGAVAAATQYVAGIDAKRLFSEDARADALDVMAAPESRDELAEQMEPGFTLALEGLGQSGEEVAADPTVVARSVPTGYAVQSYSDEEAVVDVWATTIFFAEGRQALTDVWTTQRVTVGWVDGDWRLLAFSGSDGPAPPQTPTSSTSGSAERINAFDEYVHIPAPR